MYSLIDPGTAHPISRYNEEERVVKPTTSTSNTHVAPKVTKPQETEKSESTKNKRQRRQRTAAETKQEEEKKVLNIINYKARELPIVIIVIIINCLINLNPKSASYK